MRQVGELRELVVRETEALEPREARLVAAADELLREERLELHRVRAGGGGRAHELARDVHRAFVVVADLRDDEHALVGVVRPDSHACSVSDAAARPPAVASRS